MSLAYINPVYPHYFADPFVFQHDGAYYAYGTAPRSSDDWQFPVLHSIDLVHWHALGCALAPLEGAIEFWAPEVACHEGKFYLYYSARGVGGRDHQLRVASAAHPVGPFHDCGHVLVPDQPFTIDAHPFRDVDGQWYLFYSCDFLKSDDEYRIGTGIVVDRLTDMVTMAGSPRIVVRPFADWQLFLAQRPIYDGVFDWHTIEGAAVCIHEGRYYCFYSGGAWERSNYGISYVVADHPYDTYRQPSHSDMPLVRSVPGQVIGPGHNSFTRSPDGREQFMVYHAWDSAMTARLMRIDRVHWRDGVPEIDAPTYSSQPLPSSG